MQVSKLVRTAVITATTAAAVLAFNGPAIASQQRLSTGSDIGQIIELGTLEPGAPGAIEIPDEDSFTDAVAMSGDELSTLSDAERAELVDTKIVLTDSPGEYATIEPEEAQTEEPAIRPFINEVACGTSGRHDYYRLVNTSGTNYCFANSGTKSFVRANIKGHCPGANKGEFRYRYFNGYAWVTQLTPARGPYSPSKYTTCHWLNKGYESKSVHIY